MRKANQHLTQPLITGPPARAGEHSLAREIVVVLVVKFIVLAGLWYAFFRGAPSPEAGRLFAPVPLSHQETPR